ncbi:hypothetical protein DFH09DRAFT_276647 [Mycena vulgaris]|nr:hypothetical protein DFH09DRAFT_276647 [Mycena vulgaris]
MRPWQLTIARRCCRRNHPLPLTVLVAADARCPSSHSPASPPPSDDDNDNDTEQNGRAKSVIFASGGPTSPALPHSAARLPTPTCATPALTNVGPPAPANSRTPRPLNAHHRARPRQPSATPSPPPRPRSRDHPPPLAIPVLERTSRSCSWSSCAR